jgi:hypothetical protein
VDVEPGIPERRKVTSRRSGARMLTYLKYAAFVRSVSPAPNSFGVWVFGISRRLGILFLSEHNSSR